MTVTKADIILLEAYLRKHARVMNPKLHWLTGLHNDQYDQPIQVTLGSNSFRCDAEELSSLIDAMDDEHTTPSSFLEYELKPLLRKCADR